MAGGDFTFVQAGALYDNTGWVQTSTVTAIGTAGNTIDFTQFSGAGSYTAGTGISVSGTTVTVPKSDGSSYTFDTQDTNTTYAAGDFDITQLNGYSAANYLNSQVDVPTASSGSTLPAESGLTIGETIIVNGFQELTNGQIVKLSNNK